MTVLERSEAAHEASWAAAGMLAPGGEFESGETAQLAVDSLRMYPEFVNELRDLTGLGIDFRVCGTLEIDSPADPEQQAKNGIRSFVVGWSEAAEMVPGLARLEGTIRLYPDDALVDPRETCGALLRACRLTGVTVVENCEARSIEVDRGVRVESSQGSFAGNRAVLAAGAWSGGIPLTVRGVKHRLPGTHPVRGVLVGRKFAHRTVGPFVRRGMSYLLQRGSGLAIAGTTSERAGFDPNVTEEAVRGVIAGVEALWPEFARGEGTQAWVGFRPASDDGEPHIGRLEDLPVWLAYGHFRNGILMAPATAARVAKEMTEGGQS